MIKKLLLFWALIFVILTVNGQSKLSPYTLSFINHHSVENSAKTIQKGQSRMFAIPKVQNGVSTVGAFVKLVDGASTDELSTVGATISARFGNILTVQVPVSNLVALSELSSVKRVDVEKPYRLNNDKARLASKVNLVNDGNGVGLTQTYTGKGVVYGTVDVGIDVNHIAFTDANGVSRVKRVYFPGDNTGTPPAGIGIDNAKFIGSEYTTPEQIAKLTTDTKTESHGTHTAGIGAGGYKGNGYYGMAPDADLVLCGTDNLSDVNILNGTAYAMNYATSIGEPAVVNLSLGGHTGAHDGTSNITVALDRIAGAGKIIVISAGNEGSDNLHLNKTFSSTTDQLKSFIAPFSDEKGANFEGYISTWGRTNAPINLQVVIYDKAKKTIVYQSKVIKQTSDRGYVISDADEKFAKYFRGYFKVWSGKETDLNGKYNCYSEYGLTYNASSNFSNYSLGVIYTSDKDAQIDAWIDDYDTYFASSNQAGWSQGDANCSISDMATGDNTISVGAYSTRYNYTTINGDINSGYNKSILNKLAYFSSYGPDTRGIMRPDIVGPGYFLVSSVNSFDDSTVGVGVRDDLAAEVTANKRKHQWGIMSGTSMSSPAVAGIIALWLQADPTLDAAKIKEIFKKTAIKDNYVTGGDPRKWGAGKIDALAGILEVLKNTTSNEAITNDKAIMLYPNPSDGEFSLYVPNERGNVTVNIYNLNGSLVYSESINASADVAKVNVKGSLANGVYAVQVLGNGINYRSRLVIK
ncbi:MAG: S8 family serine peptidase [Bacteroidaceae bacterium]